MSTCKQHKILYRAPLRDIEFLLWEHMRIQERLGVASAQEKSNMASTLNMVKDFVEGPMTQNYRQADEQEAYLGEDGKVKLPDSFPSLMRRYREIWQSWQGDDNQVPMPEVVQNLVVEMLVGANPSFVTYVGFNGPAQVLLNKFGSPDLIARYGKALKTLAASACLCITEKQAGSDLNLLTSMAQKQDNGEYHLQGHKWLISAGMHELTDNIYYFILARTNPNQTGMMGISCFFVPRYLLDADGKPTIDNGIRCREVVQKMGLRSCANTHLEFSQDVPTVAYLLGEKEGHGLQQLMIMMTPARISTGIYALGLASAATETARQYSQQRVQGKNFEQSMSAKAPSLTINQHPDIIRMRLDMLAVTTGCRALIARLGLCQGQLRLQTVQDEDAKVAADLLDILLPIVKAYTSDQAWRVTETAIQSMGGVGYLRDYGPEQNARDCKILSIWEGTNHMQSLFLIRDKLGLCLRPAKLESLRSEIQKTSQQLQEIGGFAVELERLQAGVAAVFAAAEALGKTVRGALMNSVPEYSCEFQSGLAEVVITWQLLDAANIAQRALQAGASEADQEFYQEKVACARHFAKRRLPQAVAVLENVQRGFAEALAAKAK